MATTQWTLDRNRLPTRVCVRGVRIGGARRRVLESGWDTVHSNGNGSVRPRIIEVFIRGSGEGVSGDPNGGVRNSYAAPEVTSHDVIGG